jgi:Domain of unknown function (DUF6371)/CHC2 zinc finger
MIEKEKIELIKNTANDNILEVIGDFVSLKKRGSSYFGLSPFNNERSPSFTVHPAKGIFKCFSSGHGGDVIKFLMVSQNWKYIDAIKYLAKKFAIDVDDNNFIYEPKIREPVKILPPSFIYPDDMLPTLNNYQNDSLFKFLVDRFSFEEINGVFKKYMIGVGNLHPVWTNFLIYWQIDIETYIRSGKYMRYKRDGHRDKSAVTTWHHVMKKDNELIYKDFNLVQCFFGEHLITENIRKPIAIVESEKTAMIASIFMDKYYWLACGSKNGLSDIKCKAINNRSVTLFPDLGAFKEWEVIAKKNNYNISEKLEEKATDYDRNCGLDLADYLLRI